MNDKKYMIIDDADYDNWPSFDSLEEAIAERDAMIDACLDDWTYFNPLEPFDDTYRIVDHDGYDVVTPESVKWNPGDTFATRGEQGFYLLTC